MGAGAKFEWNNSDNNMPTAVISSGITTSDIIYDDMEAIPAAMVQRSARRERTVDDLDGKKPGNNIFILMECTNQVADSNTPTSVNTTSIVSTPAGDANNFLTPTSHFEFQEFQKAEKSLEQGQKLLQCRRCRGPVPSPATPGVHSTEFQESRRLSSQSTSTRKLFSGSDAEDHHYQNPPQPESPLRQKSKKARTVSSVDLSPISLFSPVTSLEEQITSLFVSSPCLVTSSRTVGSTTILPPASTPSTPGNFSTKMQRSTSCSSITGITLPHHNLGSPINEPSFNTSSLDGFNCSFSTATPRHHFGTSSLDLNGNRLNCSRSCCSPRRVNHNSQLLHTSHYSDSGLSCDGDSIDEYHNMIPSPVAPPVSSVFGNNVISIEDSHHFSNSMEHARDYFSGNHSDHAFSLNSYSNLQRSVSLSTESVFASSSIVLECPNPKCGFRFCSSCEESEHPGRSCHLLSSDHFENSGSHVNNSHTGSFGSSMDYSNGSSGSSFNNVSSSNSNKSSRDVNNINSSKSGSSKKSNNMSSSSSKSGKLKNQKKIPLRRLARL